MTTLDDNPTLAGAGLSITVDVDEGHITSAPAPHRASLKPLIDPDLDHAERVAEFRSLQAFTMLFSGPKGDALVVALRRAESDPIAAEEALAMLDSFPTRWRRNIIASFATLQRLGNRGRR